MDEPNASASNNNNNWIRCQSKSRPGQFYMFNKKSGETRWCTTSPSSSHKTQQNILVQSNMKTPAQDRLKRLQKNLEKTKHKDSSVVKAKDGSKNKRLDFSSNKQIDKPPKSSSKSSKIPKESIVSHKTTDKPQKNNEGAPVAAEKKNTNSQSDKNKFRIPKKPPTDLNERKASKRKAAKRKHNDVVNSICTSSSSVAIPTEQLPNNPSSSLSLHPKRDNTNVSSPKKIRTSSEFDEKISLVTEEKPKCDLNDNIEPSNEQTSSIMSVIKDFCSSLFKKAEPVNKVRESKKPSNLSHRSRTSFKSKQSVPKTSSQNSHSENLLPSPQFSTNSSPPSSTSTGIANDRLQRLRQSLQHQSTIPDRPQPILSPMSYSLATSPRNDSVCSSSSSHFECESMDWQPICEDFSFSLNNANTTSPSVSNQSLSNVSTQSEHRDIINENLLRLAADKNQQKQEWRTDYFYFVVDTNVFLENVTFVDELTTMKLCDTDGTVIYIPYCVLQELDKLKIRSPSESIKTRATRAIHYINKAFEKRIQHIQAQSSSDENKHLIKVTSPDDSILNCCLQVKEHIDNVMLLTEDINLRNKALCSDILVSTKSDLISKHESRL
ncbi:transcriptional protein SWT1 [Eupeodes corollae]|uniref:transcriptional protein SWT1 n=1 Tax=Eupeodes corollae TaxID=290404 RepID=UPI0024912D2E|nr:transcriptional protein SWT1 [Eupeodes corollae]